MNQKYRYRERNDRAINLNDIIESQLIELTTDTHSTIVGIIYRPPNDDYEQFKEALKRKLDLLNKKCLLMEKKTSTQMTLVLSPPDDVHDLSQCHNKQSSYM